MVEEGVLLSVGIAKDVVSSNSQGDCKLISDGLVGGIMELGVGLTIADGLLHENVHRPAVTLSV